MLKPKAAPKQPYTCKNELEQLSTEHVKYYAGCIDDKGNAKNLIVKLVLKSADDRDKEIIDRELEFIKLITPAIKTDKNLASAIHRMYDDTTVLYLYSDGQPSIGDTYNKVFMAYYDKSLYDYLTDNKPSVNTEVCKSILSAFVYDIGDALVYLHKQGIIHFNVNSKSILIRRTHTKNNQHGSNIKLMLSGFSLYKQAKGEGADSPVVNNDELFAAAATSPLHQYFHYLYLNNHGFTVPLAPAKGRNIPYILLSKHCKEYKKEHWYSTKSYCAEFPDKISYYHDWFGYFCVIYNILSRMYLDSYSEFNPETDSKRTINSAINLNISLFQGQLIYKLLKMLVTLDLHVFYYGDNIYSTKNNYRGSIYEALYNFLDEKDRRQMIGNEFKLPENTETLFYNSNYIVISSYEDKSFTKRTNTYTNGKVTSNFLVKYNSGQPKLSDNTTNKATFFSSPIQNIIKDIYPDNITEANNSRHATSNTGNRRESNSSQQPTRYNPVRVGGVSVFPAQTKRNNTRLPSGNKTKKRGRFGKVMSGVGAGLQGAASVMQALAS